MGMIKIQAVCGFGSADGMKPLYHRPIPFAMNLNFFFPVRRVPACERFSSGIIIFPLIPA